MSGPANPERGEASLRVGGVALTLRPSFAALVERAAAGRVTLAEMVALFWHCLSDPPETLTRERLGEAVAEAGLAVAAPVLGMVLRQILAGR